MLMRFVAHFRDGTGFDKALVAFPMVFLLLLSGLPLIYNILMSFQEVDMFSLASIIRPFAGIKNYIWILTRPESMKIFSNTAIFVVASIAGQFVIGFALALFFQNIFPGSTYIRGLFLVSWVMPGLVVGAIWNWILSGDFGVFNYVLKSLHIIDANIFWRSDPKYALWAIIMANIWLGTAFNMIMLSVGLAAIPKDINEAASLDGATGLQRFWTMTLPMMRSTIGALISLGLIFTLQQFDLVASITSGGPNNASNLAQYWAWDLSFKQYDFAKGATISVVMILLVMVASVVYVRSTRHEVRG